jgi:hypothetical protein
MNFKVFGAGLLVVGLVMSFIGFNSVFPNFGKSREASIADAMRVTDEQIASMNCYFNGTDCEYTSGASAESLATHQLIFYAGIALCILGVLVVVSSLSKTKS